MNSKTSLPLCEHLGQTVIQNNCKWKATYVCDELHIHVQPNAYCQQCSSHSAMYDLDKIKPYDDRVQKLIQQAEFTFPDSRYGRGKGDGVIYVGGGKYWEGIVAGILMLRDVGSTLPVEVWYRGDSEKINPIDVVNLGVEIFDIDEMGRKLGDNRVVTGNLLKGGWEAKLYAIYHSEFDRVLFLDADAYVVANPEPMFSMLNAGSFIYWKDFEDQKGSIRWENVYPPGSEYGYPPVQGGQLFIDKIKAWKMVHIANYICQNSDYYFRHMFGDQDTWRVASAVLAERKESVSRLMLGNAEWREDVAFVCHWQGKPVIVHRCQGKMYLPEYIPVNRNKFCNPQYRLPSECRFFDIYAQVVNRRDRQSTQVFTEIYKRKLWGLNSGAGTALAESRLYIDVVNRLVKINNWKTAIDVGTGDGVVSSYLEFDKIKGYDCVESWVNKNNSKYGGTHELHGKNVDRNYYLLDIIGNYDIIDSGDVLLCKDVLHHWPTENIEKWLDSLILSKKWKAIVLCQDRNQIHDKQDCHLGGYRALSYLMYPLNKYQWSYRTLVHHKELLVMRIE